MSATPSAQYRLTIRVKLDDSQGLLGQVTSTIGEAGGIVGAMDLVEVDGSHSLRDVVVDASGRDHWEQILQAIDAIDGAEVIDTTDRTFQLHIGGKIEQANRHPLKTRDDLSMVYTPGVARVCRAIADDPIRPSSTRSSATPSRSSPMAPRCSASATSGRVRRCR